MDVKAIILAGGYGKRLKPLTEKLPKPMLTVGGKPIIEWQVEWLRKNGIKRFLFLIGYKGDMIKNRFNDGSDLGVEIEYSIEEKPLGTAGALYNARKKLEEEDVFFMVNGDIITNLDPRKLVEKLDNNTTAVLAAVPLPSPYGILEINKEDRITGFIEKPLIPNVWISAGVYFMKKEILYILPSEGDIEKTAFPELSRKGKLKAYKYTGVFWKSIDSHKDLEETDKLLRTKNII